MEKDLNLVKIVSYLFFDGHLYKDLKCFYFSSKHKNLLKEFGEIVEMKFKIKGQLYLNEGGAGKSKTHKYRVFSKEICTELEQLGVPKGDKTINEFLVPSWIIKNRKFAKEFIKIAYLCEGSMKEKRKNPRIKFNLNKAENLIGNGIKFITQIKKILEDSGIKTTEIGVYKQRTRKDGVKVKELRFRIITEDNNRFIKEIGWLK
jgi:DNA-binding transcriptional regulator WhiA